MSSRRLNGNEPFRWKPRRKYIIMHSRRNSLKKAGGAMIGWLAAVTPRSMAGRSITHSRTIDATLPPSLTLPPPIQSRCIFGHRGQEMATNARSQPSSSIVDRQRNPSSRPEVIEVTSRVTALQHRTKIASTFESDKGTFLILDAEMEQSQMRDNRLIPIAKWKQFSTRFPTDNPLERWS